jgi:hypothetical protein
MSSSNFHSALGQELTAVGITGRLRRRVLDEFADHLACDPDAALGDPAALARQFADELGSVRARTAAVASFIALALAGTLFAIAFVLSGGGAFGPAPRGAALIGRLATGVALLAPQVAFVAGILAVVRWLRRRGSTVLPAAEATVMVRRAAVGVVAGIATMVSLGTLAVVYRHHVSGAWMTFAVVAAAVGTCALLASLPPIWGAIRLRPVAGGPPGDVFDDLGGLVPARLRGRPWLFAVIVSGAVAVLITVVAVPAQDEFDGAVRGIFDALLCLLGFATLGRFLGLWSPRRHRRGSF